jgi:predicted TIM-barrel fold metal-dependent hydrolase
MPAQARDGAGGRPLSIVDTHLHVIDRTRLSYPWLSGVPALDADFLYETYAIEAARCGITDVLHMEVDVAPADIDAETLFVARLASRPGSLLRGAIAACRPEDPGFPARLEDQLADSTIRGFRRVLHTQPDALSESGVFRTNIARLAGTGRPFDICMAARQLPLAIALVDSAPEVQFVLDHCGVPDIAGGGLHPWREHVSELARRPNVVVKISGVMAYGDPATWALDDLRPYVEHAIAAFGWDRVVWGSDWPVCTLGGTLATWVAATHALLSGTSAVERAKLLATNARRVWGLSS